jgi:hypothetical protein
MATKRLSEIERSYKEREDALAALPKKVCAECGQQIGSSYCRQCDVDYELGHADDCKKRTSHEYHR